MKNLKKTATWCLLIVIAAMALFPFYMILSMGTYRSADLFTCIPVKFSSYLLQNLRTVLEKGIISKYLNSVIVSGASVIGCLFTSICIGFAIAKYEFRCNKLFLNIILIGMMLPTQISVIGYVMEMRAFHLTNTLWSVILVWVANPFSAFFMTQFIRDSIPRELLESARMDGCSEPGILVRIVVPCMKPAITSITTLVFLWSWNNYLLPLIILNKDKVYTLPLMISNIAVAYIHDYGAQMLALGLSTFPVLIIFIIGSRYFVKGITAGAVKG